MTRHDRNRIGDDGRSQPTALATYQTDARAPERKPVNVKMRRRTLILLVRTGSDMRVEARARNPWQSISVGPSTAGASFWANAQVAVSLRRPCPTYANRGRYPNHRIIKLLCFRGSGTPRLFGRGARLDRRRSPSRMRDLGRVRSRDPPRSRRRPPASPFAWFTRSRAWKRRTTGAPPALSRTAAGVGECSRLGGLRSV